MDSSNYLAPSSTHAGKRRLAKSFHFILCQGKRKRTCILDGLFTVLRARDGKHNWIFDQPAQSYLAGSFGITFADLPYESHDRLKRRHPFFAEISRKPSQATCSLRGRVFSGQRTASGEYAISVIPSSRQASRIPFVSGCLCRREYST